MGEPNSVLEILDAAGTIGLLVVIVFGALKGWWVPGWAYKNALREIEQWKDLALTGTEIAERLVRRDVGGRRASDS